MKKLMLTTACLAAAASVAAQDLSLSGYLEFEAAYGENYDVERIIGPDGLFGFLHLSDSRIRNLDYGVDGNLNIDYANSTKSGLEYGAHFELGVYKSDRELTPYPELRELLDGLLSGSGLTADDLLMLLEVADYLGPTSEEFEDAYVFINSAVGNIMLGDTGDAGEAANQLHVPFLAPGALEVAEYSALEKEQIFYSNAFAGIDFEASVDDDANWALGIGYSADVGAASIALGLSAG